MKKTRYLVTIVLLLVLFAGCANTGAPASPVTSEKPDPGTAASALSELEPHAVFSIFEELCAIPRASGDTKAVSDYLVGFAQANELEYYQDIYNNVVIWAPASAGYEDCEPIALQAHMDMVCVSEDKARDPAVVGVKPRTDGEWIWADGTSLGADDGIGLSIILSILADRAAEHPPIEAVITVDEENGLAGASSLDVSVLRSRRMLNLDSEEEYVCTASSAAGRRVVSSIPVVFAETVDYKGYQIGLDGLLGGHSGLMIHLGRANANVMMARLLSPALEEFDIRICEWKGGTAHNVIASDAHAVIAVPEQEAARFAALLNETGAMLMDEYAATDPGMAFHISETEVTKAVSPEDTARIVAMLCGIPDGLIQMSKALENVPEVSLNSGVSELTDTEFKVKTFMRSNASEAVEPLYDAFLDVVTACHGSCVIESDYGAWDYAEVSPIRDQALQSYQTVLGREATVALIHGGLECGIFAGRIPGIDIVAIGANLLDAHSVEERVEVQSVADIYAVTRDILKNS